MKAGTEAFSTFLAINPQVAMSLNVRSTLFFTSTYSKGLSWYRQQMACKTKEQTTIEKAPQYFPNALAPQRIYKMNKHIKLILLVRNPIDRAVSHYLQVKNSHPEQVKGKSFEDIVFTRSGAVDPNNKYIYLSKYSLILKRWLKYFKLSQILILNGDEFKEHQINVLAKAESFLGIKHYITEDKFILDKEKGFYCLNVEGSPACLGSGKGREHPALSKTHYHKLRAYFRPYNAELSRIARQKFDW
ncbi:heparan sulfate glucosamine 3-O-sulfotransferase 4-like [Mercenaria mercenaria]|uniref:heparan sulfate glucosamine 3-O-sulfotransferase 4-like n=1 Tax=Mercenaria mercenaria TaxID=6596 RepID=UPI001E1D3AB4|nr:heparan sulfate glucosamine 3-O-sulfotransferase 4-like [Mercenaria mercenaria]